MRVLHLVKTSDGATWAALQVEELTKLGVEVHVALPSLEGRSIPAWKRAGAIIHELATDFPVRSPWTLPQVMKGLRSLVDKVRPDIIHSHFVGSTLVARYALGKDHHIPRLFQVPGPLHLEHSLFRNWEIGSAGPADWWIGSSRCIVRHYEDAGVPSDRLFLSYYGTRIDSFSPRRSHILRARFGLPESQILIGNMNYMYPPKLYLGQRRGLKGHEDIIDAFSEVLPDHPDWTGVLIGGQWGQPAGKLGAYEAKLRRKAAACGPGRILMPGLLPSQEVANLWADFDLAIHVPFSENCGGIVEPMLAGVPIIASRVGGLPEVVIDGITGQIVSPHDPKNLALAITGVISNLPRFRLLADRGQLLAKDMFNVTRTSEEIYQIYNYIINPSQPRPISYVCSIRAKI